MRKVIHFDVFASVCPYFNPDASAAEGHGCLHPEQEVVLEDKEGAPCGCCLCRSCPLGIEPELEDLDNEEVDWGTIEQGDCVDKHGEFIEGEFLMVDTGDDATDDQRKALGVYEKYMNRYLQD